MYVCVRACVCLCVHSLWCSYYMRDSYTCSAALMSDALNKIINKLHNKAVMHLKFCSVDAKHPPLISPIRTSHTALHCLAANSIWAISPVQLPLVQHWGHSVSLQRNYSVDLFAVVSVLVHIQGKTHNARSNVAGSIKVQSWITENMT